MGWIRRMAVVLSGVVVVATHALCGDGVREKRMRYVDCADVERLSRDDLEMCESAVAVTAAEHASVEWSGDSWSVDAGEVTTWAAWSKAAGLPDGGSFWSKAAVAYEVFDAVPQRGVLPASAGVSLSFPGDGEHVLDLYDGPTAEILAYVDHQGSWVAVHGGSDAGSAKLPEKRWISAVDAQGDCLDQYPVTSGFYGGWVQNDSMPGYFELENAGPYGWERLRVCDPATAHVRPSPQPSGPSLSQRDVQSIVGIMVGILVLAFLMNFAVLVVFAPISYERRRKRATRPDPVQSVPTVEEQKVRDGEPIGGRPKGAS